MNGGADKEIQVWRSPSPDRWTRDGKTVAAPDGWVFVPAGDPGLTRRLKAEAPHWVVMRKWKNRVVSAGLLAPEDAIQKIRAGLEAERRDPEYLRKLEAGRRAREHKQQEYELEFRDAVLKFLNFAPSCAGIADRLADAVVRHAIPVGSGTVARTQRIPVQRRAEAAVIAWMRHQTTDYDNMRIPRIKGRRREVRGILAGESRAVLRVFREGRFDDPAALPLLRALERSDAATRGDATPAPAPKRRPTVPPPAPKRKPPRLDDGTAWLSIGE